MTSHINEIIHVTFYIPNLSLSIVLKVHPTVTCISTSLVAQMVKKTPAMQGTQV